MLNQKNCKKVMKILKLIYDYSLFNIQSVILKLCIKILKIDHLLFK